MSANTCKFVRQEEEWDKGLPLFVFEAPFLSCAVSTHPKEPQCTAVDTWAPSAPILGQQVTSRARAALLQCVACVPWPRLKREGFVSAMPPVSTLQLLPGSERTVACCLKQWGWGGWSVMQGLGAQVGMPHLALLWARSLRILPCGVNLPWLEISLIA